MADLKKELVEKTPGLANMYEHRLQEHLTGGPYVICRSESNGFDISLFDSLGRTLCGEPFYAFESPGSPAEVLEALKGEPAYGSGYTPDNRKEYAIAYPLIEGKHIIGLLRFSPTLAEVKTVYTITYWQIAWVCASFILFSIAVNLILSNHIKRE